MQLTDAYTLDDLYKEIAELAREQGVTSQANWDELVEEVVEDHLDLGEFDPDEDLEGMKDSLRQRWEDYKREAEVPL